MRVVRYTSADRKKFYRDSRGSLEKTKSWLRKATRRKVVSKGRANEYQLTLDELAPKLNAFIKSTKQIKLYAGAEPVALD